MQQKKSAVKTISLIMIITLAGKVLGLVRDRLLTINYGTGMETNAFLTASRIPRVFFDAVFASAIAASFIPVFNEYMTKKGKNEAFRFSGNFITIIGLFTLLLSGLGMLFSEQLVNLFADGYDSATAALCTSLTRILFPTVFFTGIAYAFVGILQSMDEFNIPALISVISNGIIIVYYIFFNDKFGIYGLTIAFLIGWLAQALVQIPFLKKYGFRFYPSLKLRTDGMKKVFTLMLPVMVSTWVQPINLTINTKFGSHLFAGAGVSAIELANNLYLIIAGVFVLSITNFIFPKLSREASADTENAFQNTINMTMHTTLYIIIPMMAGLMCISKPLIALIYGGGAFDDFSIEITSKALFFVSTGMVAYAVQAVISRAFFAEQNGKLPLLAGIASIIVNILLSIALTERLDVAGLAIASSVATLVNAIVLLIPFQRKGRGFIDRQFVVDVLKMIFAALCMVGAACAVLHLVTSTVVGTAAKWLSVILPALVGVLFYFVITFALQLYEPKEVAGFLKKCVRK